MEPGNERSKKIITVPNLLSLLRILMIPLFMAVYLRAESSRQSLTAALIIAVSGLTDLFDGWIARRFHQISELGKFLDPLADKLTQFAIAICLMLRYRYVWILVLLFVVKELFMGINGLILLRRGKKLNGAMWFGKASTAVFYLCMTALIAFPMMPSGIISTLFIVTGVFLALSFVLYIPVFAKMYRESDKA